MIQITLMNVAFDVGEAVTPEGEMKVLQFADRESGISVNVPLNDEAATKMVAKLTGISVVRSLPR